MVSSVQKTNMQKVDSTYVSWASFFIVTVIAGSVTILSILPAGKEVSGSALWLGKLGFSDTPDKAVFLFWMVMLSLGWLLALTVKKHRYFVPLRQQSPLNTALILAAVICIYVCLVFPDQVLGFWQGIPIVALIVIQLATLFIFVLLDRNTFARLLINLVSVSIASVYFISAGFQTASHIRDAFHSTIVLNDVLAQSTGQIPLGNAMATYTSLLGWPLKTVLAVFQTNPIDTGIWYLLALQLATVVLAVSLVLNRKTVSRWGFLILIAVSWIVLDPNQSGQTALQSFSIAPARLLLPLLTIVVFLRVYLSKANVRRKQILLTVLGALAILSAVNNVEFGITIWAASLVLLIFVPLIDLSVWAKALFFSMGNALALLALAVLMAVNGVSLHLDWLIRVPLIYAVAGFDLIAMPTIGVHLYVAALFIAASIVGLLIARQSPPGSHEMHLGLVLGIMGTWSALSLTYFTGRSASAALISGYGLQLGVVSASIAVLVTIKRKKLGLNGDSLFKWASNLLVTLPVAISISLYFMGTDPRATLAFGLAADPIEKEYGITFPNAESLDELRFYEALESGMVGQTVYPANIRSLDAGVRSVAKSPELFLSISREMGRFECQNSHDITYWIVPEGLDSKLLTVEECADRWLPTGLIGQTQEGKSVAVLKRQEKITEDKTRP